MKLPLFKKKASTQKDAERGENGKASDLPRSPSTESAFTKTMSYLGSMFSIEVGLPGEEGVDVSHSLPDPKEEEELRLQQQKRRRLLAALVLLLLAVILFLVLWFTIPRKKSLVIQPPRDRLAILEDILDPDVTPLEILRDNTTAQHQAVMWFAFDDPTYPVLDDLSEDLVIARYVSALLYFSTNGPAWRRQLNFLTDAPVCEWNDLGEGEVEEGIVCDSDDAGRVDGIVVDLNRLEGTLPTEIVSLPYLKNLGFASNRFVGTIPTEYGLMTNLIYLSLNQNTLSGSLPTQLANIKNLESFRVHWNQLNGTIPLEYQRMTSLKTVHLEGNDFSGNLELSLCGMSKEFEALMADCGTRPAGNGQDAVEAQVDCACCTACCINGGGCRLV